MRCRNSPVCGNDWMYRRTFGSFPLNARSFGTKCGLGRKPHVKHQVGIRRHAILVAETHQRNQQRPLAFRSEALAHECRSSCTLNCEVSITHPPACGSAPSARARAPVFLHRKSAAQRVRPPRLAVAPQQRIFMRLDENQNDGMLLPQVPQQARAICRVAAPRARPPAERRARNRLRPPHAVPQKSESAPPADCPRSK